FKQWVPADAANANWHFEAKFIALFFQKKTRDHKPNIVGDVVVPITPEGLYDPKPVRTCHSVKHNERDYIMQEQNCDAASTPGTTRHAILMNLTKKSWSPIMKSGGEYMPNFNA
ncbi:MAG: hypothetical protein ACRC78_18300, partial [Planktothrix sp.]